MAFRTPNDYLILGATAVVISGVLLPIASAWCGDTGRIIGLSCLGLSIALVAYGLFVERRDR